MLHYYITDSKNVSKDTSVFHRPQHYCKICGFLYKMYILYILYIAKVKNSNSVTLSVPKMVVKSTNWTSGCSIQFLVWVPAEISEDTLSGECNLMVNNSCIIRSFLLSGLSFLSFHIVNKIVFQYIKMLLSKTGITE